jgi:hypothetical protein
MAVPAPKGLTPVDIPLVGALPCFATAGASDFLAEAEGAAAKTAQRHVAMVSPTTTVDVLFAKIVSRETAIPQSSGKRSFGQAIPLS